MGARFLQLPIDDGRARELAELGGGGMSAEDGRRPDELRPLDAASRLPRAAARLGARSPGEDEGALHGVDRGGRAALALRQGPRLDDGRVLAAAGVDGRPRRSARRRAGRQGGRTIEIQRLIGRAIRAVTDFQRARRADDLARLRRAAGRRRHALRGDLRRVRRRAARARPLRPLARRSPARSPRSRSGSSTASRCSTSTTPRTRRPRST